MNTLSSWAPLRRYQAHILVATLAFALAGYLGASARPVTFDTSIALQVNRINKQQTQYYDDSYFGIQASDLFSQTVISWFLTPSVLQEIYTRASVEPNITSLEGLAKRFSTKKYSPQNIVVLFRERDEATAAKLAGAMVAVVQERTQKINTTSDNKALFEITAGQPVTVQTDPKKELAALLGAVVGLGLSVLVVFAREYLREPNTHA